MKAVIAGLWPLALIALGFAIVYPAQRALRRRAEHRRRDAGTPQKRMVVGKYLLLLVGLAAGVSGLAATAQGRAHADTAEAVGGLVVAVLLGLVPLGAFLYFAIYKVTVTPATITVRHPFRGLHTVTQAGLISAEVDDSWRSPRRAFIYLDGKRRRKVLLDPDYFDLSPFLDLAYRRRCAPALQGQEELAADPGWEPRLINVDTSAPEQ